MPHEEEWSDHRPGSRPPTPTAARVTQRRAAVRARRCRDDARRRLDDLLLHVPPSTITAADVLSLATPPWLPDPDTGDYWHDVGMTLGMPQRRAAGIALLERERAA